MLPGGTRTICTVLHVLPGMDLYLFQIPALHVVAATYDLDDLPETVVSRMCGDMSGKEISASVPVSGGGGVEGESHSPCFDTRAKTPTAPKS